MESAGNTDEFRGDLMGAQPAGAAFATEPAEEFETAPDIASVLRAALDGNDAAWSTIVSVHTPQLRRIAGWYRIGDEAEDAVQNAFVLLLRHGRDLRDAQALRAWLGTTVRRECLRIIRRRGREVTSGIEFRDEGGASSEYDSASHLIREEEYQQLRSALAVLPQRLQRLMDLLHDPAFDGYRGVSAALGIPMGSIGPTRQRTLHRLRKQLVVRGVDRCA